MWIKSYEEASVALDLLGDYILWGDSEPRGETIESYYWDVSREDICNAMLIFNSLLQNYCAHRLWDIMKNEGEMQRYIESDEFIEKIEHLIEYFRISTGETPAEFIENTYKRKES